MIVAAVALLLFGGGGEADLAVSLPSLEVVSPADGDAVSLPLELTFRTDATLTRGRGGWVAGGYHLHASVDGAEWMPGPSDIRRLDDGMYGWTMVGVTPGRRSVRLFWSDENHVAVAGERGMQDSIDIRIEAPAGGETAPAMHSSH